MSDAKLEIRAVESLIADVSATVWGQPNAESLAGRMFMLALATEAVRTRFRAGQFQVHDAALADSLVLTGGGRRITFSRLDGGSQILIRGDGFPTDFTPTAIETSIEGPARASDCAAAAKEHIEQAVRALFVQF